MLETLGEVTGSLGRPGEFLLFGRPDDGPPPLPKKELVKLRRAHSIRHLQPSDSEREDEGASTQRADRRASLEAERKQQAAAAKAAAAKVVAAKAAAEAAARDEAERKRSPNEVHRVSAVVDDGDGDRDGGVGVGGIRPGGAARVLPGERGWADSLARGSAYEYSGYFNGGETGGETGGGGWGNGAADDDGGMLGRMLSTVRVADNSADKRSASGGGGGGGGGGGSGGDRRSARRPSARAGSSSFRRSSAASFSSSSPPLSIEVRSQSLIVDSARTPGRVEEIARRKRKDAASKAAKLAASSSLSSSPGIALGPPLAPPWDFDLAAYTGGLSSEVLGTAI